VKGGEHRPVGLREEENQRLAIGVSGDFPYLHFRSSDHKPRMDLVLDEQGKPGLLMYDDIAVRVALGILTAVRLKVEQNQLVAGIE